MCLAVWFSLLSTARFRNYVAEDCGIGRNSAIDSVACGIFQIVVLYVSSKVVISSGIEPVLRKGRNMLRRMGI